MDTCARTRVPALTMPIVHTLMERALALRAGLYVFIILISGMCVKCAGVSRIRFCHFTYIHLLFMPPIVFFSICILATYFQLSLILMSR